MQIIQIKSKFLGGFFDQNTYLLKKKNQAVLIDCGAEIEDVKMLLQKAKLQAILITHVHFDHVWNIEKYVQEFDVPVFVCEGFEKAFLDPYLNASLTANKTFNVAQKNIKYYAKKLTVGEFDFEIIFTPGHTKDSVCLKIENNLFSGDTIFANGVGRTDFAGGNSNEQIESLKTLKQLKFENVFPGHDDCFEKQQADKVIDFYI